MTHSPDQLLSTLHSVMNELGIPQKVETNEQTHDRLSAVVKLLLAPYNGRPMLLTKAEAMADLQAISLLLVCFLFPDNNEAKNTVNLLHENMLLELNNPKLKQQVADGHRTVAAARGRRQGQ